MNRRNFINRSLTFGLTSFIPASYLKALSEINIQDLRFNGDRIDNYDIIPAPEEPENWQKWRESLHNWRKSKQLELKYDGSSYNSESFEWVSSDFACCFIMICDADFYDINRNEYTIGSLIARGKTEYGGYDSVVLWHAYPRIGLDDRNQFDFYREMPQGLPGVKEAIREFHESGIKVFINYNPWDRGTRREKESDIDLLIDIIKSIDADGIFLDTMKDAPGFREKLDVVKKGIVLEGEIALPLEHIETHHMSWAQWFNDSNAPGVYRNKWFERHHMQHAIARWDYDKTARLQTAWMNGSGMMIWENVFGQWLGWSEKDKSLYRSAYSIQHQFSSIFSGEGWTPLSEESNISGVYISSWEGDGVKLLTIINRNDTVADGLIFKIKAVGETRYFDLMKGEEISEGFEDGFLAVKGTPCKKGIGCILCIATNRIDKTFTDFLDRQKRLFQRFSWDTSLAVKNIAVINPAQIVRHKKPVKGMVSVPAVSKSMSIEYTFREPGGYGNIQEHLRLMQSHKLHTVCQTERFAELKRFAIDETPVTNIQFSEFLRKSGYIPRIDKNFLKHWVNGKIPTGKEDHPVVYIDLEDARAFAKWAGKRLPTEYEWQYAAQGPEGFNYPWGNNMEPGRCNENINGLTSAVRKFPEGRSPFGCLDMCGNTWELTGNEYSDGRTRFIMLKGGSCYKAAGSEWYFDGGPQKNSFVAKMLLIWPGLDRCSTVGFRCAVDL